jgi:hypothetical protein
MASTTQPPIYDRDGDQLMQEVASVTEHIVLVPDALPTKLPDLTPRLRIMWGQHLLDDLVAGRYRSLVCAVNAQDNSHGIISQVAAFLPTSQWDAKSITEYARNFDNKGGKAKVLKYDMDAVEVLAIMRPTGKDRLTLSDLASAMRIVVEMIQRKPERIPSASVSFLEARANLLVDDRGQPPTFESVLRVMNESGYTGDVYPSPGMWRSGSTALFARYPFSPSLEARRSGGY